MIEPTSTLGRLILGRAGLAQEHHGALYPTARWSAGALWGESHVWQDPDAWPLTYDETAEPVPGLYVAGYDATSRARSASWQVGQSDLWAPIAVGSAAATLTWDEADIDLVGARFVVTTATDVLWWGTVDSVSVTSTPRAEGDPIVVTSLTAVDGFAGAAGAPYEGEPGSSPLTILQTLMALSGVPVPFAQVQVDVDLEDFYIVPEPTEGDTLALVNELAEAYNLALAWTPSGIRAYMRTMTTPATAGEPTAVLTNAMHHTEARNVGDVLNVFPVMLNFGIDEVDTYEVDTFDAYGMRARAVLDARRWLHGGLLPHPVSVDPYAIFALVWEPMLPALSTPLPRHTIDHAIFDGTDTLHRAMPFDVAEEDGQGYLIVSLKHDVSVTSWRVTAEAIAVELAEA